MIYLNNRLIQNDPAIEMNQRFVPNGFSLESFLLKLKSITFVMDCEGKGDFLVREHVT